MTVHGVLLGFALGWLAYQLVDIVWLRVGYLLRRAKARAADRRAKETWVDE